MIVTQRRKIQRSLVTITEIVDRLDTNSLTAFDERLQAYWLKRVYAAYGDRPCLTEMYCFFSKAELSRAINVLADNILTTHLHAYNEGKTWQVRYLFEYSDEAAGLQADVLAVLRQNKVKQHSTTANDAPRIGSEAIHQADLTRKLIKAFQALEQDSGTIGFKVATTNYELSRQENGDFILRRNGKVFDIFEKGRRKY